MMNIQSVGVHQNLSDPDITPGEVHKSVEPSDNVPSMKEPSIENFDDYAIGTQSEQNTWTFLRCFPGISDNLSRDLMPYEWLIFNQTHPLLKRWRLVLTTRSVPETTLGEDDGRVEPTDPVPPTMEPLTWYFDYYYATRYAQSVSATWKFIGKKIRNSKNASYDVKLRDYLIFNETDPLLKRWRLVITTRPVMMNIQSVGVHQNLSEPDITPGEVHGSVEPTDNVPSMKEPSTGNFDDNAIPGTQSETPEIENTMEHNHQENEQQIAKTGNAANSAYQMKIEENKSKIKLVRPYPLERDFM
ncbi:uncharacterized protein LOC132952814 isoform X2 [Metopolophium dirhodum]|uniref:uncharacterized protein LOC132952814 isoform X2 n=1 Tax=Metopolophium dirhodum TaxID=44670 RepID=UPI00298FF650|nr:uncharacterized protein LOC132952814 isoform X2 [Metopolophium dirhodum]